MCEPRQEPQTSFLVSTIRYALEAILYALPVCCMVDAVRIRGAYDNATYDFRPAWWHGKILVRQESNVAVMHAC